MGLTPDGMPEERLKSPHVLPREEQTRQHHVPEATGGAGEGDRGQGRVLSVRCVRLKRLRGMGGAGQDVVAPVRSRERMASGRWPMTSGSRCSR